MSDKKKIYFRCDGSTEIGLGHIIRSLALADMIKDHFQISFITASNDEKILSLFNPFNVFSISDYYDKSDEIIELFRIVEKNCIVTDGYKFDSQYQARIIQNGNKLVCIDDIHAFHFFHRFYLPFIYYYGIL